MGSVRMMLSIRRMALTTIRLCMIFVDASMEKGITSTDPITDPRRDILIVSKSGCHICER